MTVRKTSVSRKKNDAEEKVLLSQEEVFNVLKFASSYYEGAYNPLLTNQRMKDITMNPLEATSDGITSALLDPKNNEKNLIGYSEFFDLTNMLYKRIIHYLGGMLSFDFTYVCMNATEKDYKKPLYKSDLAIVRDFFDRFDVKQEFKMVLKQLLRQESFFSIFRMDGEKYILQELPENYSMITGRFEYGLLFDFNMYFFAQPGVKIEMYPPVFKKMWERTFMGQTPEQIYNPSVDVNDRNGSWVYWAQTSPKNGFWSWKFQPEIATRIPFLAPMFPDVVLQPIMRKLQTDTYIASASKLLVGKVPLLSKDVKGAAVKDAVAITPETLGKFLALLKSGVGNAIKVGAAPLEDMQGVSFEGADTDFYQNYLKTTSSSSGVNSRLIYTLDKNNSVESQLSINVDEFLMTYLYPMFEKFLEYYVNSLTKQYKFKFSLEGTEFYTNRKERFDTQMALIPLGIIMPQKIAASIGMSPFDFERQLAEAKSNDFVGKLTPIVPAFQQAGGQQGAGKNGRPAKDPSELKDTQTVDDASNEDRGE